mmetsp:Transcript_14148/g.21463  ORF Transcript_14148/g.21463 Transcript_14148/m.21463 type:complete len:218 (+) Transcript_14148:147-800(+)|eukprot:CAMPEP_0203678958 /NCGR_PEP_ID=MMETSP0090-20130426/33792_1 /ASSEMBLY_ACC=CAM_ASM_001088 /TAXON_ID=426623 /ORGANISM="Chaetoceros affinis, Strain CCMP159" /LENGTH=217 /DNA_ID=CAMNT_0050546411 /DNA_START=86 /DNA_END=739 /DNA_ORIENTATION=-
MEKAPLKIAVFDLDYTVWLPEMYELHGPPKRIKKKRPSNSFSNKDSNDEDDDGEYIVVDRSNTQIRLFHGASYALSQINKLRDVDGMDILAAVASRTDEPNWAQSCMDWLIVPHYDDVDIDTQHSSTNMNSNSNANRKGKTLSACFDHVIIGFSDKKWHFRQIQKKTNIPYESMVFFDNEMRNIRSVEQLGVKCIYTPEGMTVEAWHEALGLFDMDT